MLKWRYPVKCLTGCARLSGSLRPPMLLTTTAHPHPGADALTPGHTTHYSCPANVVRERSILFENRYLAVQGRVRVVGGKRKTCCLTLTFRFLEKRLSWDKGTFLYHCATMQLGQ